MHSVSRLSPRAVLAVASAVLAGAALVVAPGSSAAAGALDPAFSGDGKAVRDTAGCEDDGSAVAQQPDGKLLVVGSACTPAGYKAVVQRYTAAGALDTGFGSGPTDGEIVTSFDGQYLAVAPASGGDTVVGGVELTDTAADPVVARYSSTGVQEMLLSHHIGGSDSGSVEDVLVAPDGSVTAAGSACGFNAEDEYTCNVFVMKVTAGGALDTSFDTDGVATSTDRLFGEVALLPDGRVAFAGYDDAGQSVVQLLTATLAPDTTFNTTGTRVLDFDAYGVESTTAGLLVTGELLDSDAGIDDVVAAQFDLTGAPVAGFGTDGVAVRDLGGEEYAYSGAVDASGNVYLVAQENTEEGKFVLARLTPAGALDTGFGEGGSVRTTFGPAGYAWAAGMTLQSDGKPVVVGSAESAGIYDVALARYQAATPFEIRYVPMSPVRILDTRPTSPASITDGIARALGPSERFDMQVTGKGGVPSSGVSAVVLNVTAISPTSGGFLAAYPAGSPRPGSSNLNFTSGQIVPNLVKVKLGDFGRVSLFNGAGGQTHLAVDVAGWYSDGTSPIPGGSYVPLPPSRIVDSRAGRTPAGDGLDTPIARTASVDVTVAGKAGVPLADVSAVVLNVTVTGPTAGGFLTAYLGGTTRPNASNLNFRAGQTVANLVIVGVGDAGVVSLFNGSAGTTNVLVDVAGYFTKAGSGLVRGSFQGLTPSRVLETRAGGGPPDVKLAPGEVLTVQIAGRGRVPATGVSAVALNVTAVAPTSGGFLTVYPADAASRPVVSNVNFAAGQTVPNAVIVKLSADGKVKLYNALGSTHVLFDVAGWYDAAVAD